MKLTTLLFKLATLVVIAAGATAGNANAADFSDSSSSRHVLHFAGSGEHTLEVRAITGHITVEAYDGPDVEVLVNRSVDAWGRSEREAAENAVKLETSDNSDRVRLVV